MSSTPVSEHLADLGSALALLGDLAERIESIAATSQGRTGGARLASDLFAVEASLRTAHRRLEKVLTAAERR